MASVKKYAIEVSAQTGGVDRGLKDASKSVEKNMDKMTKAEKAHANKIDKIRDDVQKEEKQRLAKYLKTRNAALERDLKRVKGNAQKEYKIKKKYLEDIEKKQQQVSQQ